MHFRALLIIFGALSKPVQAHLAKIEKDNSWVKHKGLRYEQDKQIRARALVFSGMEVISLIVKA